MYICFRFSVRVPGSALEKAEQRRSGRRARPACTGLKPSAAWARWGMLTMMVTKGKPRKKPVLAKAKTRSADTREM